MFEPAAAVAAADGLRNDNTQTRLVLERKGFEWTRSKGVTFTAQSMVAAN